MSKSSDRVFHLVVTAFALTLAVVSTGTLVYQHHPDLVKSWIKPLDLLQSGVANQFAPAKPPAGTHPDSHQPVALSSFQLADNHRLIHVAGHGNVPQSDVHQAEDLLAKYHIPDAIAKSLKMNLIRPVRIYLAQNASDYKSALADLGVSVSEAQRYSQDTGGFTQGDDIVIPLYQNKSTTDLVNSLAHELTHVYLNENVGEGIPSWINEGTAVTMGMLAQQEASSTPAVYEGYARQMEESVLDAVKDGKLVPLTSDESEVLAGTADYDLELQDWLAVRYLIQQHGYTALAQYFRDTASSNSGMAFLKIYGTSPANFNQQFTGVLKNAVSASDPGVQIQLLIPPNYKGYVRVLQHGTQLWSGFKASPGTNQFSLSSSGELTGPEMVKSAKDSTPVDATTTYIDLDPDSPFVYKGQSVESCGFALDYHYGTYTYVNAWITYKSGKSVYLQDPNLFGVKLLDVTETPQGTLLSLLSTPTA